MESFNWWWQNKSDRFAVDRGVMPLGYTLFWSFPWALVLMVYCSPVSNEKKKFELDAQSFTCILFRFNKVFYCFEFIKKILKKKNNILEFFKQKWKTQKKNWTKIWKKKIIMGSGLISSTQNTTQYNTIFNLLLFFITVLFFLTWHILFTSHF